MYLLVQKFPFGSHALPHAFHNDQYLIKPNYYKKKQKSPNKILKKKKIKPKQIKIERKFEGEVDVSVRVSSRRAKSSQKPYILVRHCI